MPPTPTKSREGAWQRGREEERGKGRQTESEREREGERARERESETEGRRVAGRHGERHGQSQEASKFGWLALCMPPDCTIFWRKAMFWIALPILFFIYQAFLSRPTQRDRKKERMKSVRICVFFSFPCFQGSVFMRHEHPAVSIYFALLINHFAHSTGPSSLVEGRLGCLFCPCCLFWFYVFVGLVAVLVWLLVDFWDVGWLGCWVAGLWGCCHITKQPNISTTQQPNNPKSQEHSNQTTQKTRFLFVVG